MGKRGNSSCTQFSRRAFLSAVAGFAASAALPTTTQAEDLLDAFIITEMPDGYTIESLLDGSFAEVVFDNNSFTVCSDKDVVLRSDPLISNASFQADEYLPAYLSPSHGILSVPAGYTFLTTQQYGNITTWAVLVATLIAIGVSSGKAAAVASAVFAAIGANHPAYLKIWFYYNNSTNMYFQVIRVYSNSDYTGQIYYGEYGPYSSSSPLSDGETE